MTKVARTFSSQLMVYKIPPRKEIDTGMLVEQGPQRGVEEQLQIKDEIFFFPARYSIQEVCCEIQYVQPRD